MSGTDLEVHGKPWKYAHGSVGAARRAAEAGRSKIMQGRYMMCGQTVGRATSVSEAYLVLVYVRTWRSRSWCCYMAWSCLGKVVER